MKNKKASPRRAGARGALAVRPVKSTQSKATLALALVLASASIITSLAAVLSINADRSGQVRTAGLEIERLQVGAVNSKSARLTWPAMTGVSGYNIYLAPEQDLLGVSASRKLIATLPAATTSYVLDNLAANTWSFVRVEGVGTGQYFENAIKTQGGYNIAVGGVDGKLNISLASPLRSVSLVAPNIMQLVLENKNVVSTTESDKINTGKVDSKGNVIYDYVEKPQSVLGNYTGPLWQAGPWSIKRNDGSAIGVKAIYRDSVATGQWDYSNSKIIDVDHQVYLVLDQPLGQNDVLSVSGPSGLSFILPFSDKYLETPVIQLNQVGYNPRATERYAYLSWWLGDGGSLKLDNFPTAAQALIVPQEDKARMLSSLEKAARGFLVDSSSKTLGLPITIRSANDADAGGQVNQINLISLPANDNAAYRIHLPGVGVSYLTQVSEYATLKAFYIIMRGLYLNRWGRDLQPQWTNWSTHAPDHPYVWKTATTTVFAGLFPKTTEFTDLLNNPANKVALSGGHHDAGDFDQGMYHFIVALNLLRGFEANPTAFTDNQLSIPESGNGIPDYLDEALYELKVWEQLQDVGGDGGIPAGVEAFTHPTVVGIFAENEKDYDTRGKIWNPYFTYSKNIGHSLRIAGEFAQASRLVKPFNPSKSAELNSRAVRAYNWALAADSIATTEKNYWASLLYATGELYKLTGEAKYKSEFDKVYVANSNQVLHPTWSDKWSINTANYGQTASALSNLLAVPNTFNSFYDFLIAYVTSAGADTNIVASVKNKTSKQAVAELNAVKTAHAYRNGRPTTYGVGWGLGAHVSRYVNEVYADQQLNPGSSNASEYFNAMSLSADYILGANPLGRVWFTGLGTRPPLQVLHNDSLGSIKSGQGQMPGIPVYGPMESPSDQPYYFPGRTVTYPVISDRPTMWRYSDSRGIVKNTEFDVSAVQTPDAELFAALIKPGLVTPASWLPGGANHENPYPNNSSSANALLAPANLTGAPTTNSVALSWSSSVGSAPVLWYKIYRDGVFIDTTKDNKYTDAGLAEGSRHDYAVSVVDVSLVESSKSAAISVTLNKKEVVGPTQTPSRLVLFDGENAADYTVKYGSLNNNAAYEGLFGFEGTPVDQWHYSPFIKLNGSRYLVDISSYKTLSLWVKVKYPGEKVQLKLLSYSSVSSSSLDLNKYVAGGKLDTTYRQAVIPIADFGPASLATTRLIWLYFVFPSDIGGQNAKLGAADKHGVYVDNIVVSKD